MRVAVLAGGRSSEHDVSLASAGSVLEALEAAGHECRAVVIGRDGVWRLRDPRQDTEAPEAEEAGEVLAFKPGTGLLDAEVVFPVLHGLFGEDGTVQGLLECADVPYVGAGVLASALCMDKVVFKRLMAQAGMPQVDYEPALEHEWAADRDTVLERVRAIPLPRFVKPARARLQLRHLEGRRARTSSSRRSRRRSATTRACWWRPRRSAWRSSAR